MSNDVIEAARRYAEATGNDDLLALVTVPCAHTNSAWRDSTALLPFCPDCMVEGSRVGTFQLPIGIVTFDLDAFVAQAPEGLRDAVWQAVYVEIAAAATPDTDCDSTLKVYLDSATYAIESQPRETTEAYLLAAFGGAK